MPGSLDLSCQLPGDDLMEGEPAHQEQLERPGCQSQDCLILTTTPPPPAPHLGSKPSCVRMASVCGLITHMHWLGDQMDPAPPVHRHRERPPHWPLFSGDTWVSTVHGWCPGCFHMTAAHAWAAPTPVLRQHYPKHP